MGNFFGGYEASAFRSALVLLILGSLALFYKQFEPINWRHNRGYLLGLLITATLIWGPFYYAILTAGVGISLALNYASLVIGMFFFGRLLAKERFTKDKLRSTVIAFIGIFLIFSPSIQNLGWLALGAAVLSGFSSGAHYTIAKKLPYNPTQSTLSMWAASLIANAIMAIIVGERLPSFEWHAQWGYLTLFSLASVMASWLFVRGAKLIEAGAAGVLGLLEIVFGVLFGVVFFDEKLGLIVSVGMILIITAAAIPYIKDYNDKRGTLA